MPVRIRLATNVTMVNISAASESIAKPICSFTPSAAPDRIGLRRLYQIGQIIFTVATLLCFFAKSLPFLLIVAFGLIKTRLTEAEFEAQKAKILG